MHRERATAEEREKPLKLTPVEPTTIAGAPEGRRAGRAHFRAAGREDIKVLNKTSQNLHAEMLLRLLGKTYGNDGSFEEGTRMVRQFLVNAGVDDSDFFLRRLRLEASERTKRLYSARLYAPAGLRVAPAVGAPGGATRCLLGREWMGRSTTGSRTRRSKAGCGPRPAHSTR